MFHFGKSRYKCSHLRKLNQAHHSYVYWHNVFWQSIPAKYEFMLIQFSKQFIVSQITKIRPSGFLWKPWVAGTPMNRQYTQINHIQMYRDLNTWCLDSFILRWFWYKLLQLRFITLDDCFLDSISVFAQRGGMRSPRENLASWRDSNPQP